MFRQIFSAIMSFIMTVLAFFGIGVPQKPVPEPQQVNIIYMIGDGMGFNHLELAKQYLDISLFMDDADCRGEVTTYSLNSSVTDSAAAGTALACGIKTNNGCVGVYGDDASAENSYPMSLTELAQLEGMKTGILTSDKPYGATPAAFSSHTSSRNNNADIVSQQISSGIDLMWFAASGSTWSQSDAEAHGYKYVTDREQAMGLEAGTKTVGEFTQTTLWKGEKSSVYSVNPSLSELTEKAVELLGNDDGFFLMIEGAHIDKNAHNNNTEYTAWAVDEFDNAVEKAVDFAKRDGNTIVIVTADHETGGVTPGQDGVYAFTTGSHTSANVPLLVYGCTDLIANGDIIDNTALCAAVAAKISDKAFPAAVSVQN